MKDKYSKKQKEALKEFDKLYASAEESFKRIPKEKLSKVEAEDSLKPAPYPIGAVNIKEFEVDEKIAKSFNPNYSKGSRTEKDF